MPIGVDSEIEPLRAILLASLEPLRQRPAMATDPHLDFEIVIDEQAKLAETLERYGVRVYWVDPPPDVPHHLFIRDLAVAIGDSLLLCSLKSERRRKESANLETFARGLGVRVLRVDSGIIEGGDLLLDGQRLYVGIGGKTDAAGLVWLERNLGDEMEILPIEIAESFVHLDLVFNLLGGGRALVYPPALRDTSLRALAARYELIEVGAIEQLGLAANVLSLSPRTIVSERRQRRVNEILEDRGYQVIRLEGRETAKLGGGFRCMTCPLIRAPDTPKGV